MDLNRIPALPSPSYRALDVLRHLPRPFIFSSENADGNNMSHRVKKGDVKVL